LPCSFAVSRKPGEKTDNEAIRELVRTKPPLVMFGSYNERMYLAEMTPGPMKPSYIPASFPGAIIRRHTGTPFMGYSGATYIIQEFCNSLFDALFNILPLGTELDKIDATPGRADSREEHIWDELAQAKLTELIQNDPVLVQISSAKQLRDRAERDAKKAGEDRVTEARVIAARRALLHGEPA
jgi:3,8-divinyl chlorophyllide a/chlorophyllide a reductase subunit Z